VGVAVALVEFGDEAFGVGALDEGAHLKSEIAGVVIDGDVCRGIGAGGRGFGGAQGHYFDPCGARTYDAELFGGGVGEIDDTAPNEGAAVVDTQVNAAVVLYIGDPYKGAQGQGLVCGGHAVHVVNFAVGGLATMEFPAVPGGETALLKPTRIGNGLIPNAIYTVGFGMLRRRFRRWW